MTLQQQKESGRKLLSEEDMSNAVFTRLCIKSDQHTIDTWKAAYEEGHADALRTIPVFESNNLK